MTAQRRVSILVPCSCRAGAVFEAEKDLAETDCTGTFSFEQVEKALASMSAWPSANLAFECIA